MFQPMSPESKPFRLGKVRHNAVPGSEPRVGLLDVHRVFLLTGPFGRSLTLSDILHSGDPVGMTEQLKSRCREVVNLHDVTLLPPLDEQECWGTGMTYSKELDPQSPNLSLYEKAYFADRPFFFTKGRTAGCCGPGGAIIKRADSCDTIAEAELAAYIAPSGRVVGYTIGSDVTARDIEQSNTLYISQAKGYEGAFAVGPWVWLGSFEEIKAANVSTTIQRNGQTVFTAGTTLSEMFRHPQDLADWFARSFTPAGGAILITGNGIAMGPEAALQPGDLVTHQIPPIGKLVTTVEERSIGAR